MDKSTSQAFNSLIPSLIGPLPLELTELAGSLLAQSRSKASSLKADEEIARSYACANIACERLKQTLELPKIEPRPPCPPRVYQKLYKHLDGALPAGTTRKTRFTKSNEDVANHQLTPAAIRTLLHERPSVAKRRTPRRAVKAEEVPQWVMSVIRQLCKGFAAPAAPPHVFAGVSSINSSIKSIHGTGTESIGVKLPALLVAVFLVVYTRLSGVETPTDEYSRRIRLALATVGESVDGNADIENVGEEDVNLCMRKIGEQQWTRMDWFANIPIGSGVGEPGDESGPTEIQVETDIEDDLLVVNRRVKGWPVVSEKEYLQPGLGTMMQDKVDYLSDERRRDYQHWKKDILSQIPGETG